jgi:hypothetical protein
VNRGRKWQLIVVGAAVVFGFGLTVLADEDKSPLIGLLVFFPHLLGSMMGGPTHDPTVIGFVLGAVIQWLVIGFLLSAFVYSFIPGKPDRKEHDSGRAKDSTDTT